MPLPQVCCKPNLVRSGMLCGFVSSLVICVLAPLSDARCWPENRSMYRKTETTVANCAVAQDEATNVAKEEELRRLHDAHAMQTVGDRFFGDGNWEFASKSFANAIGYSEGEAGAGPKPASPPRPPPLDHHRPIAQRYSSQTQLTQFTTGNALLEDITRGSSRDCIV